ncbi:MAG: GtrA family protein [Candidatus Saccharimonadales bacterium]
MTLHLYYQGPMYSRLSHFEDKKTVVAYMLSGFFVTIADYGSFVLLFTLLSHSLLVATVVAYLLGLLVSYLLNRYWVFRKGADRQTGRANMVRYAIFLIVNLSITYGVLWALEQWFGITPYLGKFVVGAFMFFWVYAGNKYWVFRGPKLGPIRI